MKLINNWKQSWRFTSVQTALLLAAVNGLFAALPLLSDSVSVPVYAALSVVGNLSIVILRIIQQDLSE